MIAERLPLLPPFRWRLKQVPLGLDYPYWIDDPDFDLEYHVRELALAPPPTDAKLAEQVARIFARPLDRARPLWELYLIYGLSDGNVGLLTKIHHAAVDGMSGAEIMGVLLDLRPEGREPPPPGSAPDREPGDSRCSRRTARRAALPRTGAAGRCPRRCRTSRTRRSSATCRGRRRSGGRPRGSRARAAALSRVLERTNLSRRERRSTVASRRTADLRSASCRWTRSKRSRTRTGSRSTT